MIFVMDNCSIHHGPNIVSLILEAGHRIEYLPPYSPDLNPIKQTFNLLKKFIKRHIADVAFFPSFEKYLIWCLQEYAGDKAYALFKHSGYNVEGVDLGFGQDEVLATATEGQNFAEFDSAESRWMQWAMMEPNDDLLSDCSDVSMIYDDEEEEEELDYAED